MPNTATYKDWLFVTVPEDATQFEYTDKDNWPRIQYFKHYVQEGHIDIPKGSYQIIGKGDALDNSQWSEIVDSKKERGGAFNPEVGHYQSTGWTTFYKNYEHPEPSVCIPNTATESGHSLLRSLGMEPETTLVLKKNS